MATQDTKSDVQVEHVGEVEGGSHHIAVTTNTYAIHEDALGNNLPEHYYRSVGFIGTVAALCLASISQYLGFVLPANLLSIINRDIGPSANINWVSLSFTLGLSVGFLLIGRFSDIFGRRWFFIGGNTLALIGSIVGSTAHRVEDVIVASAFNGVAGAVQISFTIAIAELVPNKHRPIWVAGIFFSSFEFACLGPVVAQTLAERTSSGWRWSYYLDVIASGSSIILFYFFYHPPNFQLLHENRSKKEQFLRQDFLGFVLFTGGLILFIMGLSWGGVVYAWDSSYVIATIVVGFVLLAAFAVYDGLFHRGDPLLPMHLFRAKGYAAMVIIAMVGSCVYYSMNILWPQQIDFLFGGTPTHKGWLACVIGSSCLLGQIFAGILCRYVTKSRYIMIFWTIAMLAFSAGMVSVQPGEEAKATALLFMSCFSMGVVELCSLALAPLALPAEDIGVALGALGSIRSGGATVATAIYTTILTNKLDSLMGPRVTEAAESAGLPQSSVSALLTALTSGNFTSVPGITSQISEAVGVAQAGAAAEAFRYVWYAVIAFCCLAVGAAFFTIDYGSYLNDEVARKMHGRTVGQKGNIHLPSKSEV